MILVDKNLHTVLNRQRIDPPSSKAQKAVNFVEELVSQPQTTPNHDPGDPYTPGFVVHHLLKLRVGFLDPYSVYSTLQCTGLSYLARVLTSIPFSLRVNFLDPGFSPSLLYLT